MEAVQNEVRKSEMQVVNLRNHNGFFLKQKFTLEWISMMTTHLSDLHSQVETFQMTEMRVAFRRVRFCLTFARISNELTCVVSFRRMIFLLLEDLLVYYFSLNDTINTDQNKIQIDLHRLITIRSCDKFKPKNTWNSP